MTSERPRADLLIEHAAQLAVIHDDGKPRAGAGQGRLDAIADGAVAVAGDRIVAVGTTADVRGAVDTSGAQVVDASGKTVLPGLVDPHTHPLFGGLRHDEYAKRLAGVPMDVIFAEGGGMHRSVRETRKASDDDLRSSTGLAFRRMLAQGTTAIEAKSGYGLNPEQEIRGLQLLAELRDHSDLDIAITFLGAHFIPEDYIGRADEYVDVINKEMLPAVAKQGIAEFYDISMGDGTFSEAQAERMVEAASPYNLRLRMHVDGWIPSGGWAWAVRHGAISADHVSATTPDDIRGAGPTTTVANLIPAAELVYLMKKRGDARVMIETGVPVAIATDYCSSIHVSSLQASIGLAAAWYEITPAEATVAATLNGAYSINRASTLGSLDVGKQADIAVFDVPDVNVLAWGVGTNYLNLLVKRGRVLVDNRGREPNA